MSESCSYIYVCGNEFVGSDKQITECGNMCENINKIVNSGIQN